MDILDNQNEFGPYLTSYTLNPWCIKDLNVMFKTIELLA